MLRLLNVSLLSTVLLFLSVVISALVEENPSYEKRQATDDCADPPCYAEILRGRDGRDGRDGNPGPPGMPGRDCINAENVVIVEDNTNSGIDNTNIITVGSGDCGVVYVRWGRTVCPDIEGTDRVYRGRAAGSYYSHTGGGSNYQCLPEDPETLNYASGTQTGSYIYGAEYEMTAGTVPPATSNLHDHDVPCAVCYAKRKAVLMIPAKYTCPQNWTREYHGFLMSSRYNQQRSTFECVDESPETIGSATSHNGALFYHVEPRCGSLPCPPYEQEKEMACVVCTR